MQTETVDLLTRLRKTGDNLTEMETGGWASLRGIRTEKTETGTQG